VISYKYNLFIQVILDYGCPRLFTEIVLTNSNDGGAGTRMAGAFTVFGTNDFVNLTVLVTGTLQDPGSSVSFTFIMSTMLS
jgi:hypothetical protein